MRHLSAGVATLLAFALTVVVPARATEATFERDLTVSGRVDLAINNGSGFIHLTSGPAGHVHVFARVHSSWGTSDDAVQQVAAHPPVQQTGNIVRIGPIHQNLGNVNIDYEIQAPADAYLDAAVVQSGVIEVIRISPLASKSKSRFQASEPWRAIFKSVDPPSNGGCTLWRSGSCCAKL